jgi:hypothetical protein
MPTKPVISNNSPLVALWKLDLLSLLRDLYFARVTFEVHGCQIVPFSVVLEVLYYTSVLKSIKSYDSGNSD